MTTKRLFNSEKQSSTFSTTNLCMRNKTKSIFISRISNNVIRARYEPLLRQRENNTKTAQKNKHFKKVNTNQADATLRLFGFIE